MYYDEVSTIRSSMVRTPRTCFDILVGMLYVILSLAARENGEQKTKVRIGLATFDSTVHFYNMEVGCDSLLHTLFGCWLCVLACIAFVF